jgi:cell division septation protein DedD
MEFITRFVNALPEYHQNVTWPSSAQASRQLGIIALVVVLWGVLLAGCLPATTALPEPTQAVAAPTASPEPTQAVAAPTALPEPTQTVAAPTDTVAAPTEAVDTPTAKSETPPTEEPSSLPAASFSGDVFPLLESRCVQCHGPGRTSGGVRLDSYDAVMAVVVPGDAAASLLVEVVATGYMPPRGPELLPSEIEIISAWVNAGAPDD